MKFEVGKLYQSGGSYGEPKILKCLFVTPTGRPVFVDTQTGTNEFIGFNIESYKEYHEPVSRWFNKYRIKDTGEVFLAGNGCSGETRRLLGYSNKEDSEYYVIPIMDKYEYLGAVEIKF